ncbi:unnamed protein product [Rhizoctonia solani]|uniref:Peptidase C14 caspase domain-containing protein n=1 Tax=Rhizoctonia solani TaxID=456999 RepID=A0A8H3GBW6_9AGAM|nr:unnamed protein product [Rhizoctonia solani]
MISQRRRFSALAALEKLTGETSPQESSQFAPASLNRPTKSNIHALVIGINQYLHHTRLRGAVNDANIFKSYLLNDLIVPEIQITTLFDAQATRAGIIHAFQNFATDPKIKPNDPIVIYYAGHGAEIQPPPNRRAAHGSLIQCLVPQDAGNKDLSTPGIPPIPDFTINSLLKRIANAKGNNISVIFDSCHSASITRTGRGRGSRAVPWLCFPSLPDNIDSELAIDESTCRLRDPEDDITIQGMQSHVLLAACSSKGLAYEDLDTLPHHGYFTTALLKILRSVGSTRLTYKSCIQRLPKIEASCPQDPVCEGINIDRMFFNAMVAGPDNSFILLEEKDTAIYLQAGSAHGITPGCLFAIHADLVLDHANPSLGTMVVDQVTPFQSLLKPLDKALSSAIPNPAYGRQIGTGNEHALDIYISPEFEKVAPPDSRWKIAFSGGENNVVLRLVERELAALIIDVDANESATFTFPRLEPAVKNGLSTLRRTVPVHFQSVYRVISAAARFIWHLERFPQPRPFQKSVKMEFYKLKESGRDEETGSPVLDIDGSNLNFGGFASVEINSKDRYAFRILNTSSRDLYAYLFYFSLTTLAISPRFLQVVGKGQVDPSLPKGGNLTLGYGPGGVQPFQFNLGPGDLFDVGVYKLFLSTSPIDLSSVEQGIPFGIEPRRLVRENEAKHKFGALEVGIWDAITMELKLSRPVKVQNSGGELEILSVMSPLGVPEAGAPGGISLLTGLNPEQHTLVSRAFAVSDDYKFLTKYDMRVESGGIQFPTPGITVISSLPSRRPDAQANFYNLCTKLHNSDDIIPSFEEHSKAGVITRSNSVKPPLHALIIGINKYKSYVHLAAAVPDALSFQQYLTDELLVPKAQIRTILDDEAKRGDIIGAFQDLANEDNGIKHGEAIVIYYAGYGSEVQPPPDQTLNNSLVQCIIPQDVSLTDGILPIPEFTIGALVYKIAREKGNNITLIFDCGYSTSGSSDKAPPGARSIDKRLLPPLPAFSDYSIIQGSLSGSDIVDPFSLGWFLQGMDTNAMDAYVFIAACGPQETALEDPNAGRGHFSMALLYLLKSVEVDSLTYKDLIRRIPALKTNQSQNPVCEGRHIVRMLFNGQVQGARTNFIVIEPKQGRFYLQAGLVQGITPGSTYAIHPGDGFGPFEQTIGTIEVDRVDPFTARVKDDSGLHALCYGRQVGYGPEQALDVYVSETFVKSAEPSDIWPRAFSVGEGDLVLRPASPELAQVVLSIGKKNETTFTLTNPISVKHCIQTLPPPGRPPIPPSAPDVIPILRTLAKWNWYLRHVPTPRPFQAFIDMEFYKLQPTEDPTDQGGSILRPEGENLAVGGEANVVASPVDLYGVRVLNRSSVDLYVYLYEFSLTSLAIKHKTFCGTGPSAQGLLLPQSRFVTFGYGSDEQIPFTFSLGEDQYANATILKLFVSTHPADFDGIEQESPFEMNGTLPDNGAKGLFGRETIWDAVDMSIVYRRMRERDEIIIEPFSGLIIGPAPGSAINPVSDVDPWANWAPQHGITLSTSDTAPIPSNGGLFTGRSSRPLQVQPRTTGVTSRLWFRTPALTRELLSSVQCMRLRTSGYEIRLSETTSNATGAYFTISVIGSNGFRKHSENKREMTYHSHSTPADTEWVDGTAFEESHELWRDLEVGDCFEVSVCAQGDGWIYEASMGNLIFW